MRMGWIFGLVVGLAGLVGGGLRAADFAEMTREAVRGEADRSAGSEGAGRSADYFAGQLKRATGQTVHRQRFSLVVPVVERCEVWELEKGEDRGAKKQAGTMPGGGEERAIGIGGGLPIFVLEPMGAQVAALKEEHEKLPVVYVGKGTLGDLRGKVLANHFVVMEAGAEGLAWQTAVGLGARAVIFLGDGETGNRDFLNKVSTVPIGVPRFYCDDAGTVGRFRKGEIAGLHVDVRVKWVEREVENLICVLPAKFPQADGKKGKQGEGQVVVLQARYDGASCVLGRAPGATQAMNAAVVVQLAEEIRRTPEHCAVVVALTAGDMWNNRGTQALYDLLGRDYGDPAKMDADLPRLVEEAAKAAREGKQVVSGLGRVAEGDFSALRNGVVRQVVVDELDRRASKMEEELQAARLARDAEGVKGAEERKRGFVRAASGVKNRMENLSDLEEWLRELVKRAAGRALPGWEVEAGRREREAVQVKGWVEVRKELPARLPMLQMTVALTGGGEKFGFFWRSDYSPQVDASGKMSGFVREMLRYGDGEGTRGAGTKGAQGSGAAGSFVAESMENRFTLESFFPEKVGFSSDGALLRGQAAGAFATVLDGSAWVDTPNDGAEKIDWEGTGKQVAELTRMLVGKEERGGVRSLGALTDPLFYGRTLIDNLTADQKVTILERTLGETIPRLGAAMMVVGGENELGGKPLGPNLPGTRRIDWRMTRVDGTVEMKNAVRVGSVRLHGLVLDERGLAVRAIAGSSGGGNAGAGMVSEFVPDGGRPQRAMLFDCQRLDAMGLFDPRYMEYLDKVEVLDARRRDKAQYSNVYVQEGMGAVFMPVGIRWQMLVAKGSVSNRMVLIHADMRAPEGRGFGTTDVVEIGPLAWRNATDLYVLDTQRQTELQRHGISNEVIKDLQTRTGELMADADRARATQDYEGWYAASAAAWGLQSQVYGNLIGTSNGIIQGVIFLLLGIIPFSYFLERLIIGATNVYKQIAWFGGLFAVMTGLLWFHPAFRISSAPLMILLAFLILILSTTVVYILFGKFEEEIARMRGAGASAHSASLRRGAVIGAAVRLGLSNMRRRGTRTTLTLVTLVLLTFTLLCFTSVRESVQITPRVVEGFAKGEAPPEGILVRQRGWKELPTAGLRSAAGFAYIAGAGAGGRSEDVWGMGEATVAARWWLASEKAEQTWLLPIAAKGSGQTFFAQGLVGLSAEEGAFQRVDMNVVLPGFEGLGQGARLCWLPAGAKAALGVSVGEEVEVVGQKLVVAGFFTDEQLGRLKQLTGDPMTPTDPASAVPQLSSSANSGVSAEEAAAKREAAYRFLSPSSIAIVPAEVVRDLGGQLSSVMVRPAMGLNRTEVISPDIVREATDLARRSAFTVFVSDGKEVRSINAAVSSRPQDLDAVLIPMIIAGVIVLNTMLGAVAERTKEIHVYTSVGLAPAHVGMLFLAEAAALGTLGVVFGYIFGQGLATLLTKTGLLADVDLNYSSLSAVVTMGIVLAIVMGSALWPARAASRVATPSLQKDWRLPKAEGDTLRVELPFTVNETAAQGVCAFLEEFLLSASQSGTGKFTADNVKAFVDETPSGTLRGLACRVWLAPYDLGVIEAFWLGIYPTHEASVFEVKLMLVREAGNPATWYRLNRPFLVEVRKQFLLWRAVRPELVEEYVRKSAAMFAAGAAAEKKHSEEGREGSPEGLPERGQNEGAA